MDLPNPVVIYQATSNVEAEMVRVLLVQSGIEAFAVADLSPVGLWFLGTLPNIHQPKVFVDRSRAEEAAAVVQGYEERLKQQRGARRAADKDAAPIEVVCDACGKKGTYRASERGTVQACRHCGAYLDVGETSWEGDWQGQDEDKGEAAAGTANVDDDPK